MVERTQLIWRALKEQTTSGQLCDVSLRTGDGGRVWAHSCVLAAFSPRFPRLLSRQCVELRHHRFARRFLEIDSSRAAGEVDCVRCLARVVQFVYSGAIEITDEHWDHLWALSGFLQSEELANVCEQFRSGRSDDEQFRTAANSNIAPVDRCSTCSFHSRSADLMAVHSQVFHSNTYNCLNCGSRHKNVVSLVAHIKQDCRRATICSVCLFECGAGEAMAPHLDDHLASKPFKCSACLRLFDQRSAWLRHVASHADGKVFSCSACDLKFNSPAERDKHYKSSHGPKKHVCAQCGFSAPFSYMLEKHKLKHRKSELSCDADGCQYRTSSESMLVRHRAKHKSKKPLKADSPNECSACQMKFTLPKNLRRHMKTHASQSDKLKCPHCDYVTYRRDNLNDHVGCKHFSEAPVCGRGKLSAESAQSSALSHNTLLMNDEGDIQLVNASETNSVTLRNIGNLTGSITLDERTGVLTMNNINSGSVFLNETTGQLTYVNIENDNNSELNCFSSKPLDNFKTPQVPSRTLASEAIKLDEFTGEIVKVVSSSDELFDPEQEFDSFEMDVNDESLDGFDDFDEVLFDVLPESEAMGLASEASGKPHLDESTGLLTFVDPNVSHSSQELWSGSFSGGKGCQMIESEYQLLLDEVTGVLHGD